MAKESQFGAAIKSVIEEFLEGKYQGKYQVRDHEPLLYEIRVDNNLEIMKQERVYSPKRGSSAFETDLCIFEKKNEKVSIPRVVIEFKTKITTHDVLTYSVKASKHKQIYPYLRYGMIASGEKRVPGRLFTHNEGLDFFASVAGLNDKKLNEFITELLNDEITASTCLEDVAFGSKDTRLFRMVPLAIFE